MPIQQTHRYVPELDYWDCRLTGSLTSIEPLIEAGRKLVKMAGQKGARRYLNDMRGTRFELSHEDLVRLAEAHSHGGVGQGWKRALVVDGLDPQNQFYEIVSANRDSDIRLFTDREEALRWLLEE